MWNTHVEPLVTPGCWGYSYRASANSKALLSCHSSATAWDINAPQHPNGRHGTITGAKLNAVRAILAFCEGVVYWGGDGWGARTWDEMHMEIAETGASDEQVAALARKITALYGPRETWPAVAPVPGVPTDGSLPHLPARRGGRRLPANRPRRADQAEHQGRAGPP